MQHHETRAASRRRPAPASLLAATLLAALSAGTQAQTAFPPNPTPQGSAAAAAPGSPAPAVPAAAAVGVPGQVPPAPFAAPAPQAGAPGTAPVPPAVPVPHGATPPPAAPLTATPAQPFPGATMGAPSYNPAVPQPARPGALPQPDRPGVGMPPPLARAPVPALPTVQSPPVKGLPAEAPKLVINGGVHSPNPAKRLVIVNGQVVREGADLGAGVVLEQIRPDSVVLGFRGGHFHVMY